MFWRVILLVVFGLASMKLLNVGYAMVSAPNDAQVIVGLVILLALLVGWYYLGKKVFFYFKQKFSEKGEDIVKRDNIHRLSIIIALFLFGAISTGCGRTVVGPGHVGIQVDYYGQDKGVESYPKVTGVVWYNPFTTSVLEYPTFVQTAVWTHSPDEGKPINEEITFTTSDQMQVSADISLAYHLLSEKVPAFYVKFRSDDLNAFTHGFLRNLAREKFDNVAGRYKIEQIMGDNAPFLKETREMLQRELDPVGVQLDQFGFIGAPRPPKEVIAAINEKVRAVQDAIKTENQVRQTRAQAEKDVAQAEGQARANVARAEGQAKANQVLSSSITPTLIEWRRLDLQQQALAKWNGVLSYYNGGGNPLPMIQIPNQK